MLLGSVQPHGKIVTDFIKENDGNPQATVVGGGFKTSVTNAALANAYYAQTMDYDDVGGYGYPSTSLLAAGELTNASGKDIVMAYIVGVELASMFRREGNYD